MMVLENLDATDWKEVSTQFDINNVEMIPVWFRELISDETEERRTALINLKKATYYPYHEVEAVRPVARYIVPFIVELIEVKTISDRLLLLQWLRGIMELTLEGIDISCFENSRINYLALGYDLRIYEVIRENLSVYLQLLHDKNEEIRLETCRLLKSFSEDCEKIVQKFMNRFLIEENYEVQTGILRSIARIVRGCSELKRESRSKQLNEYRDFLVSIINDDMSDFKIKIQATKLLVQISDYIPQQYLQLASTIMIDAIKMQQKTSKSFSLYDSDSPRSLATSVEKGNYQIILMVFEVPGLEATVYEFLVVALMDKIYRRIDRKRPFQLRQQITLLYSSPVHNRRYSDKGYPEKWRKILTAIIGHHAFWEVETNLFSHFYGLPDSREGLQKILDETNLR